MGSNGKHASARAQKPRARVEDLVIEELEDEILVYDPKKMHAHCLGATAARVWRACDGSSDVTALCETLELSSEDVTRALAELEVCELLETDGLNVVQAGAGNGNGNGNGIGITRRQMTMRSAKVGAAVLTAPLVYSINVNSALAALTPTPFQCEVYTVKSCGSSTACGLIAGCCCCCQGGGSCKTCGAIAFCRAGNQPCSPVQGGGFGDHCSSTGTVPADARGCCGVTGADDCGCGFGPFAGCCNQNTGVACTPSNADANCFPCCNGVKMPSSAALGCCKSATVDCCSPGAPLCCQKSTLTRDCCSASPHACCAGPVGTC